MKMRAGILAGCLCFCAGSGCWSPPQRAIVTLPATAASDVDALLRQYPLAAEENIRSVALGSAGALSLHLVQIRHGEAAHVHASHDLVVTLMRGEGVQHLDGREQRMRAGDVAVVPRGTPHFFVNTGSDPAVAFVAFTPPYDGKDQLPVQ